MDKTEIINAIYGACRLHSWIELVTDNSPTEPIEVKVSPTMLPEAVEVLKDEIGQAKAQDIPVTIDDNVIAFDNLKRLDYNEERYQIHQYNKKI